MGPITGRNSGKSPFRLSPTIFSCSSPGSSAASGIHAGLHHGGTSRFSAGNKYLRFYLVFIYIEAFQKGRLGYAAALAWILTIISAIVVIIVYNYTEKYVYYEEEGKQGM
jgi:hypothetical protein